METNGFCVVVESRAAADAKPRWVATKAEAFRVALDWMGWATERNVDCTARVFRAIDGRPDRSQPQQVHVNTRRAA